MDTNDQLLEQLSHAIMGTLGAPAPQAPMAPNPVGLSPLNAAAAAMNPQFAPLLLQQANAPAQNQYASQQAAFEAAMSARNHALQSGVTLAGSLGRNDNTDLLNQIRIARLEEDARAHRANEGIKANPPVKPTATPAPKYVKTHDIQGNEYWVPTPTSGGPQPVTLPGGAQATTPANKGEQESSAAIKVFDKTLSQLEDIINRRMPANESFGSKAQRGVEMALSHVPGSESLAMEQDAKIFNARRNDLGTLARTLYNATGIRAYQEVIRLINNIPSFVSDPVLARKSMQEVRDAFNAAQAERARLRPQVFGDNSATTPAPAASLDDEFDKWKAANAPK